MTEKPLSGVEATIKHLNEVVARRDAEIQNLREALTWYADPKNWKLLGYDSTGQPIYQWVGDIDALNYAKATLRGE